MFTKKVIREILPECKTCVHFINDEFLSTKLKNIMFRAKIIGSCSKLIVEVKEQDFPKCKKEHYKHYLDRLLD
jgi:hypothetical protein